MVQVYQAIFAWQTFSPLRPGWRSLAPNPTHFAQPFTRTSLRVRSVDQNRGYLLPATRGKGEKGLPAVPVTLGLTWGVILGFELGVHIFVSSPLVQLHSVPQVPFYPVSA